MDDQLLDYLDADTNIVRFQRRFDLVPGARDDDAAPFKFVFHRQLAELDQIEPRTRLEHAILNHLAAGKHWRTRTGAVLLKSYDFRAAPTDVLECHNPLRGFTPMAAQARAHVPGHQIRTVRGHCQDHHQPPRGAQRVSARDDL